MLKRQVGAFGVLFGFMLGFSIWNAVHNYHVHMLLFAIHLVGAFFAAYGLIDVIRYWRRHFIKIVNIKGW